MNELLMFVEIIVTFGLLLLSKKLFGKSGLFFWIAIASILANIQVCKNIEVLGISGTLGNVMFASNFLATDILSECYGKKSAKKGVYIGLFSVIVYIIITQISILFIPSTEDLVQSSFETLFGLSFRVSLASITMFFIANLADVKIYNKLKDKNPDKKIWLRNNVSTILCNCLENFGFVFGGFLGTYDVGICFEIAISTSILEIIIAICDTPFLYAAKKIKDLELED